MKKIGGWKDLGDQSNEWKIGKAAQHEGRYAGIHWSAQSLEEILKKRRGKSISRKILERLVETLRYGETIAKQGRDTFEQMEMK